MTLYDVLAVVGVVLGAGSLILSWFSDTNRQQRQEIDDESITDLYKFAADFEERLDALELALDEKFEQVDAELEEHDRSLDGAAANVVQIEADTQHIWEKIFLLASAGKLLSKALTSHIYLGHPMRAPFVNNQNFGETLKPLNVTYKFDDRKDPREPFPFPFNLGDKS